MKKATVISLFILAAIIGALITIHVVFGRDIDPPDVSDLTIVRPDVSASDNAFTYMAQITNIYSGTNDLYEVLDQAESGTVEKNYLKAIISSNAPAFELIEKALACEVYQVPEIKSFDTPLGYLADQRNIGRLLDLKACWLLIRGKEDQAFETAMDAVRLGDMMQDSGGGLINYLVALAVKGIGLNRAEQIVMDQNLSVREMKSAVSELKKYESASDGFANTFRVEYIFCSSAIDAVSSGNEDVLEYGMGIGGGGLSFLAKKSSYIFQPNRTKLIMADLTRHLIANASNAYSDVEWPPNYWERADGGFEVFRRLLLPNSLGEILVGLLQPAYDACFSRRDRYTLQARSVGLLLALKAYQEDEGRLPDKLEELVPEFIDAVPVDPFDGEPVRYIPEKEIFYSVGPDGVDSKAVPDADELDVDRGWSRWKRRDIVFELNF